MSCEGLKGAALKKCQDQQKKKDIPFSTASEYTIVNDPDKKAYFNKRNIPVSEQGERLYYNKETKTYKGSEITDKPVTKKKAVTKTPAGTKPKENDNSYFLMTGYKKADRVSRSTFNSYTGAETNKYHPKVNEAGVPIGTAGNYRNDLTITDKRMDKDPMSNKTIKKFENKYGKKD